MFCPKCGTKNPDNGKFCRSCGTDLGNVSAALSGDHADVSMRMQAMAAIDFENRKRSRECYRRQDPNELYGDAIKQLIFGVGFLIVAIGLLITGVAGGHVWWWAMLFPAFALLSKGVSDMAKSKRMEKSQLRFAGQNQPMLNQTQVRQNLQPSPDDLYELQDLIKSGKKIEAIKMHRAMFDTSLKEAKQAVENIERENSSVRDYVEPPRQSIYDTGDLQIPPSVTDNTTRHLEMDKEGKTMTLPKE